MKLERLISAGLLLLLAGIALAAPAAEPRYDQAMDLLDEREYHEAYDAFESYIDGGGARPDAALYWQASAMHKLGRKDRAIERLNRLFDAYPKSEWRDDAKALMVELRGEKVDPDELDDAELKMLALQSVMRNDPERAMTSIRRVIANTDEGRILEQAMFVLAQSGDEGAWKLLHECARDAARPEVARAAVQQLAIHGGEESTDVLADLYQSTKDHRVREQILNGFMMQGDEAKLSEIAHGETDPRIRDQAINLLGVLGATVELERLYGSMKDPRGRQAIVSAMMVGGDSAGLLRIAREDADHDVRTQAIQMLGVMGASEELDRLRRENPSRETMQAIITAFMIQGDAPGIIEIYRTSEDSEVRKTAVQQLSVMDSEEALEFMLEILGEDR